MKIFLYIFLSVQVLFSKSTNIAIASNLSYVMPILVAEFNKIYPKIEIKYTIGSSGKLTTQIKNGAPYDVFICADMKYPNILYKESYTFDTPVVYAKGSLVLLSTKKRDFSKGMALLEEKEINKIAIANPKLAPYGKASIEVLKKQKIYENIKSKLLFTHSISQSLAYTLKATSIGIVAKSSLFSPKMSEYKKDINWIEIDRDLHMPISQGIVIIKNTKHYKNSKMFYDFILSDKAQEIFKKYGYFI